MIKHELKLSISMYHIFDKELTPRNKRKICSLSSKRNEMEIAVIINCDLHTY